MQSVVGGQVYMNCIQFSNFNSRDLNCAWGTAGNRKQKPKHNSTTNWSIARGLKTTQFYMLWMQQQFPAKFLQ